ncbi:ATP-binding protein [Yoonia algicola]|uniref:ATP-binding protein n=1 Tax=Yoonia algicola TaxID=3137368 RepID=A0AAN0NEN2_9RHOB
MAVLDGGDLKVTTDIQPVFLYPDQAVPLSLLVAEATTNAMKYIGDQASETAVIDVRLTQDDRACLLVISNSVGQAEEKESTGLGSQLMNAFAMQVGGQIEAEQTEGRYTLTLQFNALEFQPESRDF